MYIIEAAHNPEVAGSNPAPATEKGPGNGAFPLRGQAAIAPLQGERQRACTGDSSTRSGLRWELERETGSVRGGVAGELAVVLVGDAASDGEA